MHPLHPLATPMAVLRPPNWNKEGEERVKEEREEREGKAGAVEWRKPPWAVCICNDFLGIPYHICMYMPEMKSRPSYNV